MIFLEEEFINDENFYSWVFTTQLIRHIDKQLSEDQQQEGAVGNFCYVVQVMNRNPKVKKIATQL